MSENSNQGNQPLSIFDVKPTDFTSFQKPDWGQRTNFFDPKPQDSNDKIYRAVIRILPNLKQPAIPVAIVKYYWFGDGQSGFRYNTPSTPNMHPDKPEDMMKPIGWCPVSDLFWRFKRSGDARQEQIATDYFSMQSNYICLVQIKNDAVHPENNGKIMPYKLPAAIYKRIQSAMAPSEEDMKMGQQPIDVFHPVKGRDILLKITLKNVNGTMMRDYEVCNIAPQPSSIFIDGQGADLTKYASDQNYFNSVNNAIVKLLEEQPEIEAEYGYKEADEATKRKVKVILSKYEDVSNIWPEISIDGAAQGNAQQAEQVQGQQTAAQPVAGQQQTAQAQAPVDPFKQASQQAAQATAAASQQASTEQATDAFIAEMQGQTGQASQQGAAPDPFA